VKGAQCYLELVKLLLNHEINFYSKGEQCALQNDEAYKFAFRSRDYPNLTPPGYIGYWWESQKERNH
jgi:hypothetical protein